MTLFNLLFGSSKLNPLESQVLAAVSAELSPAAREVFNKQRDLVNLVQRHADGKEVNLYVMRRGKPFFDEQFRFPLRAEEARLATVEMAESGKQKTLRAEVWLVKGRVFSIEFNKPPWKTIQGGGNVTKVDILHDPMIPECERSILESERREEIMAGICSKVPEEYLQILHDGKGVSVNEWFVCAIHDIRKVVHRDGSYYLLAEKEGMGAIGVKEDEFSGQLYYFDYGDERGEKLTIGFRRFLEEFDGGKIAGRF